MLLCLVSVGGCAVEHEAVAAAPAQSGAAHSRPSADASMAPSPSAAQAGGSAERTKVNPAIAHSTGTGGRTVALTFDDGPDPRWTPQILSLLSQYHARATFCMIGPQAEAHPELVRDIVAAGHRLCDHTVHHNEAMHALPPGAQEYEIAGAQAMISRAAGVGAPLRYFRAPGGDFTPAIRQIAVRHGLRPLGWTVDAEDWKRPGVAAIVSNVKRELRPGGIVLMHDAGGDRSETVQALRQLLPWLVAEDYGFEFPET